MTLRKQPRRGRMVAAIAPDVTQSTDLSALSRNASVISTSSSDSGQSPFALPPPRPVRTFTAPRSQSPHSRTPRPFQLPSYLAGELGLPSASTGDALSPSRTDHPEVYKSRSKSRPRTAGVTVDDFKFGPLLGEGSYSTVRLISFENYFDPHRKSARSNLSLISVLATNTPSKSLRRPISSRRTKWPLLSPRKTHWSSLGLDTLGLFGCSMHSRTSGDYVRIMTITTLGVLTLSFIDFVIDLARNGEMQSLISKLGSLSTDCARYYAAQVIDALGYMHLKGVIHRYVAEHKFTLPN